MSPSHPLSRLIPDSLRPLLVRSGGRSQRLADLLGVDPNELAALRLGPRLHYRPFTVAKPDGRERRVLAPSPALKALQRRLLDEHLARLPIHPAATAFHPGASTLRNAMAHAHGEWVATVDLRDFFDSTRGRQVRKVFVDQGWGDEEVQVLMRLCVFRDGLPQGAPTSPCLSNLVNVRLDERLDGLALRSKAVYTRYGDDLTFSGRGARPSADFFRAVEDVLTRAGYEVQPKKGWRVIAAADRPRVTGLVVAGDGRVRAPWSSRVRAALLGWRAWWSRDPALGSRARGLRGYLRMVDRSPVVTRPRRGRGRKFSR